MDEAPKIIVKKVRKRRGHVHHGGAWKIAYADFVTAMMAFFLLMWLLASTTEDQRRGISDYFDNPLRVSLQGGDGAGEQSHPIPGGGEDFRLTDGEVRRTVGPLAMIDQRQAAREEERRELEVLKARIQASIQASESLRQFGDQLLLDITSEGLRIQVIDREGRPMFASGSSELQPYARELLAELTPLLNKPPNRISITGHTDAQPFAGGYGGYSNWELSNDRANAARRALVGSGMSPEKTMRIVGLASTVMLDEADPFNAVNRRISIVLMNRETESQVSAAAGAPDEGRAIAPEAGPDADTPPSRGSELR
ncbi:MAG: motility protein MotB [Planctomycetaceae bacterium]|nr:MAG: motility protein MotB [Planctomycetaceae bacterium]